MSPRRSFVAFAFIAAYFSTSTAGAAEPSKQEIIQSYQKHAALAQLHRWYLLYEEPRSGIDNALDILSEDVHLKSALGEGQGHDQYAERVKQIPTHWKNAHNVKSTDIAIAEDGTVSMTAEIVYSNIGMLPDEAVRAADLVYTTKLAPSEGVLPKFTSIQIEQKAELTDGSFTDAYAENKLRSLAHYWLALVEDPARDPEPFQEIFADGFALNFSSGAINDFETFKEWLAGPASQVAASIHRIENFAYEVSGEDSYQVTMDFDWNGLLPNGTEMTAKTRHNWAVIDDPTQRFARIKTMDVELLEPFAPKE